MWYFILALSLFISKIFTIIMFVLGMTYNGKEDGPVFIITVLGLYGLSFGYIAFKELTNIGKVKGSKLVYLLPVLFMLIFYLESLMNGGMGEASSILFKDVISTSAVSIWVGTYCTRYNKTKEVLKNIELLAFFCSIALVFAIPTMFANSLRASVGGAGDHQTISYIAAIAFGFSLYRIVFRDDVGYSFFRSIKYKPFAILFCAIQAGICIIGGGRGGFVLIIALVLVTMYGAHLSLKKIIVYGILGAVIFFFVFKASSSIQESGIDRVLSIFYEKNAEDVDSERTQLWNTGLSCFSESPIWGHGLFRSYDICFDRIGFRFWHNLFLDFLVQGGLLYLLIWLVILFIKTRCFLYSLKRTTGFFYIIPVVLYAFVMLMFSGTYIANSVFWFVIIVINKRIKYSYSNV